MFASYREQPWYKHYVKWRFPVLAVVLWVLWARFLYSTTNPLAINGILDLTTVPDRVKYWLLGAGPYWAILGSLALRQTYRQARLDDSATMGVGSAAGFVAGPILLLPLWFFKPNLSQRWIVPVLSLAGLYVFYQVFASIHPENTCVTNRTFAVNLAVSGMIIGLIFALMAVGLSLIYSIQGIVSFAHGQLYMLGGYFSFYAIEEFFNGELNPVWGILIAGLMTLLVGLIFEIIFIRPMHTGRIERASEYAILITFGFGFFLEYTVLAGAGAIARKLSPYIDRVEDERTYALLDMTIRGNRMEILGITLLTNRVIAGGIALTLIIILLVFIRYTWWGRALRAVSMDKQAAAVVGINPGVVNTASFGLGTMLAGMAGAALIPIFSFTPGVGALAAARSYVIVVLGGLGSIPGALVGGVIIGEVESFGAGCYPDFTRAGAYRAAFGLIIFAITLLIRPTGLFGRKQR